MADEYFELELPNGQILELPVGTNAAAAKNYQDRFMASDKYLGDKYVRPQENRPQSAPQESNHPYLRNAGEFARGALEGVASVNPYDMVANVGDFISRKIEQGTGLQRPQRNLLQGLVGDRAADRLTHGARGLVQEGTNAVFGDTPEEYKTARELGDFVGATVGGGGIVRGVTGRSPAAYNSLRNATATASKDLVSGGLGYEASSVAAPVLGYVGEKLGNLENPETGRAYRAAGETIGELGGGMVGGGYRDAAFSAPQRLSHWMFADDQSGSRLAAADRLGVTPSIGLVGSKNAARMEDFLAGPAYTAGPVLNRRAEQWGQLDTAAHDIAQSMRDAPQTGQIDKSVVGRGAQDLGRTIDENFRGQVTAQQQPIIDFMTDNARTSPVRHPNPYADAHGVLDEIDNMMRDPRIGSNRKRHLPAIRAQIMADIDAANAQARPILSEAGLPLPNGNTGSTTYEALKDFRTAIGQRFEDGASLDRHIYDRLYKAATDEMRNAAEMYGLPADEFDLRQARTHELYNTGAQDLAERLQNPREASAGSVLFSPTNANSPSVLATANRFATDPTTGRDMLRPVIADQFELQTRGAAAGLDPPSPETFSPNGVSSFWRSTPQQTKDIYLTAPAQGPVQPGAAVPRGELPFTRPAQGPAQPGQLQPRVVEPDTNLRGAVQDLVDLSDADWRRPSRSRPSGGNTITGPAMTAAPAIAALGQLASGNLLGAGMAAVSPLVANVAARGFVSPQFARFTGANPIPVTGDRIGAFAGYQGAAQDQRSPEPVVVDPNFSGGVSFNPNPGRY